MHRNLIWALLLQGVAALPAVAVDLDSTELVQIEGQVDVRKGESADYKRVPQNLKLAGALKRLDAGDHVKTQTASSAELSLKDTCVLAVQENSIFEVPETVDAAKLRLQAQEGSFLLKVVTGSDLEVQTADVVAGVKGTLFEVEVLPDLRPVLLLPGLELGIPEEGGTVVHVYEGEVELRHAVSGQTRRVKAGQRLAALGRRLMALDERLKEGFGELRQHQIGARLSQKFGKLGERLQAVASTKEGIGSVQIEAGALRSKRARRSEGRAQLLGDLPAALQQKVRQRVRKLHQAQDRLEEATEKLNRLGLNLPKAKDDESKAASEVERTASASSPAQKGDPEPPPDLVALAIKPGNIQEAHLGEGTYLAAGGGTLRLEPEREAFRLQEGSGTLRIQDQESSLDALVSVREEAGQRIIVIRPTSGSLSARLNGGQESIELTAGQTKSFVVDGLTGTATASDPTAVNEAFDPQVQDYKFTTNKDASKATAPDSEPETSSPAPESPQSVAPSDAEPQTQPKAKNKGQGKVKDRKERRPRRNRRDQP